jgi:predicted nucleic acid-binding protein
VNDPFAGQTEDFFAAHRDTLIVSDFASAEFASAVGIRIRTGSVSVTEAQEAFSNFDRWAAQHAIAAEIHPADIAMAQTMLRQLELKLRAPDAIHLAAARRLNAGIATFDKPMAKAARALGILVADM